MAAEAAYRPTAAEGHNRLKAAINVGQRPASERGCLSSSLSDLWPVVVWSFGHWRCGLWAPSRLRRFPRVFLGTLLAQEQEDCDRGLKKRLANPITRIHHTSQLRTGAPLFKFPCAISGLRPSPALLLCTDRLEIYFPLVKIFPIPGPRPPGFYLLPDCADNQPILGVRTFVLCRRMRDRAENPTVGFGVVHQAQAAPPTHHKGGVTIVSPFG